METYTENSDVTKEDLIYKLKFLEAMFFCIVPHYKNNKIVYKKYILCIFFCLKIIKDKLREKFVYVKKSNIKIDVIPVKLFNNLVEKLFHKGDSDVEKCLLLSSENLKEFELSNKDWITMTIKNNLGTTFIRTIQVLDGGKISQAIINDLNMFNIIRANPVDEEKGDGITTNLLDNQGKSPKIRSNKSSNFIHDSLSLMKSTFHLISLVHRADYKPQVFSYMHIEFIESFPNCPKDDVIIKLLNNYFESPRHHHLNDIFRVNLKKYNLDIYQYDEVKYLCNMKYVYFKLCDMNIFDDNSITEKRHMGESDHKEREDHIPATTDGSKENYTVDNTKETFKMANRKDDISDYGKIKSVHILYNKVLDTIKFLLKENQYSSYITSHSTRIELKFVQSFIPNVVKKTAFYLQNASLNNYQDYVIETHSKSRYFENLMSCAKVFYYERGRQALDFQLKPIIFITGSQSSGLEDLLSSVAASFGVHSKQVDCIGLIGNTPTIVEKNLEKLFERAEECAPSMLVLHNIEDLCMDQSGKEDLRAINCFIQHLTRISSSPSRTLVVCTSVKPDKISHQIKRLFLKTIDVLPLTETERRDVIQYQLDLLGGDFKFDPNLVDYLTGRTAGFEVHDLICLVRLSIINKLLVQDFNKEVLNEEDFKKVYEELQSRYSERLDAPSIPNVSWEDIGGLNKLKAEILSTFRAAKRTSGLKRSGLLLYGPPGTGKTLIAKAVATECRMNFLAVKGPELLNKYIGQSEENIRNVFLKARAAAPCVVFFDELDSLAPRRGQEDQSRGVMDRVVSQLLAEMDGVHASKDVFILGATNRVDLLDPALLRPGRLDKSLYVGLYEDRTSQLGVLKAVVRKFQLAENVRLEDLVDHFPPHMSGADIYAICSQAWSQAIRRIITTSPDEKTVTVTMEDFEGVCPPCIRT